MKQHSVKTRDGLQLAVEVFGGGPPLVFAHGLSGNRQLTRRQFASLAESYTIITFDQRGHGESTPVTQPELYDAHRMARDIGRILDHLEIEQAIVGGESMGSATALLFALQAPERVETLLLTAPAFGTQASSESERFHLLSRMMLEQGLEPVLRAMSQRLQNEMGASPEVIATICDLFRSHDPQSLATALGAVIDWGILPDFECLKKLTMPVRVLAWEHDPLHPFPLAEKVVASVPDGRLERLPSLVHFFQRPEVVGHIYGKMLSEIADLRYKEIQQRQDGFS